VRARGRARAALSPAARDLRVDDLPAGVREEPERVTILRSELNRYSRLADPQWPLGQAIDEAFSGDRKAVGKIRPAAQELDLLIRAAGIYAADLASLFPGETATDRLRALKAWLAQLGRVATADLALGRGSSGPGRDWHLLDMCRRVAVHFRRWGLPMSRYRRGASLSKIGEPYPGGPLGQTLTVMLRAVDPSAKHSSVQRYLTHAATASKKDPSLAE
jgi:hypothetical protein